MKTLPALALGLLASALVGCGSSSDSSTEAPPKGAPPNTVQAPPGAKGPQERSMENERAKGGAQAMDPGGDPGN